MQDWLLGGECMTDSTGMAGYTSQTQRPGRKKTWRERKGMARGRDMALEAREWRKRAKES